MRLRIKALDLWLYIRVRSLARTPARIALVRRFSALGEHSGIWLAVGLAGAVADRPRRRRWARAAGTVALANTTSTTIKLVVGRRRPAVVDLPHLMVTPTGLSFPSSHATSSFAAARAYGRLLPSRAGGTLYLAACAMAVSRVYLGVHYPSDVAAGAALGAAIGTLGR